MKTGICQTTLGSFNGYLGALIDIDNRGGYFSHSHIEGALIIELSKDEHRDKFIGHCATLTVEGMGFDRGVSFCAYLTRVMLSHARIKNKTREGGCSDASLTSL